MGKINQQMEKVRNTNELLDYLVKIIEGNDERFSFECASGGEAITMEIYDKQKDIGYVAKIEQIEYDENNEPINL